MDSIRTVIAQKIEEAIKKSTQIQVENNETIGKKSHWEAASLLGLKSNQIEEFVNPTANLDRNICEDLDQMWQSGKYEQFIRSSIEYLILKS